MQQLIIQLEGQIERANQRRIPLRWRWSMWVGCSVALAVTAFALITLDVERDAWLKSQTRQAKVMVASLGNELTQSLLGGAIQDDIAKIANKYLQERSSALGVALNYSRKGVPQQLIYGEITTTPESSTAMQDGSGVVRLPGDELQFATTLSYGGKSIGIVTVRYSEEAWRQLSNQIMWRMLITAIVIILFSSIGVYWLASSMSKPLEELAAAAHQVGQEQYNITLPVRGNDEISDAIEQFNQMVRELAHKQEMRSAFARYLNPQLIEELFTDGDIKPNNHHQTVSILFADMVGFTSFSEDARPEEVVALLNRYFELFHYIIDHFNGNVDKYIGDAIMGVFNHPKRDPDHSRHVAMAAVAIAEVCRQLHIESNGHTVAFRVGIDCGQVIAGSMGSPKRLDYTVIGSTVNI
ncbi:MAG: adenylate/guanylate cyclase domain-containing protein, partial [Mariprofundales bacterium]|nr:adenylate/guanylate cyclase domain-containing protein [Mariprofundales bacterium]